LLIKKLEDSKCPWV